MPTAPPSPSTWGECRFCGVAVPPQAGVCPICGAEAPIRAAEVRQTPRSLRTRLKLIGAIRTLIVVGVVALLAYSLVSVVIQGQPNVPDPLTTAGTYTIGAGNFTLITGEITGGDFVIGNFTSVDPSGASIQLAVYNSTEWIAFITHNPATPAYTIGAAQDGRIIYSAPYTDDFYFVFENPYAPSTGISVTVYITTTYESNVGNEGFG
jgi:hypothetical protein